jgi:hypothetical protein
MKYTCRILPILMACAALAPLLAAAGQPAYPEHFLNLSIPQLPGSKVVEVRLKGKVPIAVVLESEVTTPRRAVMFYGDQPKSFKDAWHYDDVKSIGETVEMVYVNRITEKLLAVMISPKGKGSRVELIYPWAGWFNNLLEEGIDPKKPDQK